MISGMPIIKCLRNFAVSNQPSVTQARTGFPPDSSYITGNLTIDNQLIIISSYFK